MKRTRVQMEEIIKKSITYIEQNLKEPLEIETLARQAGYSLAHYQKLFSQITGVPVATFLNKRRLDATLSEIRRGRRAIDAAFDYGFETYAGFYKAFIRIYGTSPKKYTTAKEELTMTKEIKLREILENWDIPQDLPILNIPINDGEKFAENVWAVGEDYILKTDKGYILKDKNEANYLLNNLKITKALLATACHVGKPLMTKAGEDYYQTETQIFTLTRGIKGEPLSQEERFGENREKFGLIYGENIAKLHQGLRKIEQDIEIKQENLYKAVVEWALPLVRKINLQWSMEIPETFFDDYIASFEGLFSQLPQQLIHRDPNPSNIMFENGEFTGFIDFDISERNIRLWDVCYCATGLLVSWSAVSEIKTLWPGILLGILKGYDRKNPLSQAEKDAIFYVICSIQMICIAYFDGIPELQELAKTNREMFSYLVESEAIIKNILN